MFESILGLSSTSVKMSCDESYKGTINHYINFQIDLLKFSENVSGEKNINLVIAQGRKIYTYKHEHPSLCNIQRKAR